MKTMGFTKKLIVGFVIVILLCLIYMSILQRKNDGIYNTRNNFDVTTEVIANQAQYTKEKNSKPINSIFGRVQSYIDTQLPSNSHVNKLDHYIRDEFKFENIKRIQNVISSEVEELKQRGLDISDSVLGDKVKPSQHALITTSKTLPASAKTRTEKSEKVYSENPKEEESTNVENNSIHKLQKTDNIVHNVPKLEFKYRSPEEEDIEKLTNEQKNIEIATDPLPVSATCSNEVYLVVVVLSAPENVERREAIRNSWANSYQDDVVFLKGKEKQFQSDRKYSNNAIFKTVFVIGQSKAGSKEMAKVLKEAELHKDIVLGDLREHYRNLTMKTRLAMKWAYYECKSTYVLKTDDDVFINPVQLIEWLKTKLEEQYYTGWCNFYSPVVRDPNNKWYISKEDYAEETYPGYCLGGGYLMSEDVLGAILKLSYGRKLFPMEDLYVGLLIKELGNVKVQDERKHFDLLYTGRNNKCDFNSLFLAHRVLGNDVVTHIKKARQALTDC